MGGLGRQNPWPFQWGGGRSRTEALWITLRKALGTGGPGPIGGLEDAWRMAKVSGIVQALAAPERAAVQATPFRCTSHLEVYEDLLYCFAAASNDIQTRRDAVSRAWTSGASATIPSLTGDLQDIWSGFGIQTQTWDGAAIVQHGKTLRPVSGSPSYGTLQLGSWWPSYSDHHVVLVLCTGTPTTAQRIEAASLLCRALPAWVDWAILRDTDSGFYCSRSSLGLDAL